MLFNTFEFLVFLPIVFIIYWQVCGKMVGGRSWQNLFIVAASYLFYGWWDWRFLILIAITSTASFISGLLIERLSEAGKTIVCINLILNLGILIVFKYFNFFISSFTSLVRTFGIELDDVTLHLILPVGISFYTFQALSYSIDVYRQKLRPTHDVLAFFAFISFFPQLVAGPIERATNLLPQFLQNRTFNYGQSVDGMHQILWGLFKKIVVADNCAVIVNQIFDDYASFSTINLWMGAVLFAFQIYGDFSGYSDIAIGCAKLFGVTLMRNFNYPYFSRNIPDFWRRWHISLTTWFRDYIYIPLGGSRCKKHRIARNTFIVFLTSGLWHGANWTFIAWGGYHALLFMPFIIFPQIRKSDKPSNRVSWAISILLTFILVVIGWVIFRSVSITNAIDYIRLMFSDFTFSSHILGGYCLIWIGLMILVEWLNRNQQHPFEFTGVLLRYRGLRWALYISTFMLCILSNAEQSDFIYFQF